MFKNCDASSQVLLRKGQETVPELPKPLLINASTFSLQGDPGLAVPFFCLKHPHKKHAKQNFHASSRGLIFSLVYHQSSNRFRDINSPVSNFINILAKWFQRAFREHWNKRQQSKRELSSVFSLFLWGPRSPTSFFFF